MPHQYALRMINLEQSDYNIVSRLAEERGLGDKGFSVALRMIIREWALLISFPDLSGTVLRQCKETYLGG